MNKLIKEFRDFFVGGNVIDLAVAFIVGTLFAQIVKALVDYVLMPFIGIIFGKPNFDSALVLTINHSQIHFGSFLTVAVGVTLTALAVFMFVVKPYNAFRYRRQVLEESALGPTEIQLLAEIRDLLRASR
ncbi:MAG: large conductance mechanosensitive channel [Acidimicrobiia bacterium]|jgi:large conductance mechanosensitive channel|nr:large conductance mechanosensitive channel [Acidimicrobiia bacterium]